MCCFANTEHRSIWQFFIARSAQTNEARWLLKSDQHLQTYWVCQTHSMKKMHSFSNFKHCYIIHNGKGKHDIKGTFPYHNVGQITDLMQHNISMVEQTLVCELQPFVFPLGTSQIVFQKAFQAIVGGLATKVMHCFCERPCNGRNTSWDPILCLLLISSIFWAPPLHLWSVFWKQIYLPLLTSSFC